MSWLSLTIIAQFLNSVVALFDKYLVASKKITTPILYTFLTGVLTFLGILVYVPTLFFPLNGFPHFSLITGISIQIFLIILLTSISQLIALWALFSSLKKNDASDVVPVIGSMSAIFALIIGYFFTSLVLPIHFAFGFGFLVTGTLLISHLRFSRKTFLKTVLGGLMFAIHNILLKEVLLITSFDTGFFWFNITTTLLSICLLSIPSLRKALVSQKKEKHVRTTGSILLANKVLAGVAGILLIKAIEIGEVSLIQALGGLQFVFLFLLALILGPITNIDFGEKMKRKDIYQKLISIGIISIGFVLLFM